MADVTWRINRRAIVAMLRDPGVVDTLEAAAAAVADAANAESEWGGYEYEVDTSGARPTARVWNIKHGASDDEARNNRLIKALNAVVPE